MGLYDEPFRHNWCLVCNEWTSNSLLREHEGVCVHCYERLTKRALTKKGKQKALNKAVQEAQQQRQWKETHNFKFAVAGVTFDNNDGTSRQRNLESICADVRCGLIQKVDVDFEQFTYEGKPALKVLLNGLQVGNVPANLVENILPYMPAPNVAGVEIIPAQTVGVNQKWEETYDDKYLDAPADYYKKLPFRAEIKMELGGGSKRTKGSKYTGAEYGGGSEERYTGAMYASDNVIRSGNIKKGLRKYKVARGFMWPLCVFSFLLAIICFAVATWIGGILFTVLGAFCLYCAIAYGKTVKLVKAHMEAEPQ